jgi:hypothetical protein
MNSGPPNGKVVQIAYAVSDIRAAAVHFAQRLGVGPFFVRHHGLPRWAEHLGGTAEFDHSSAFGQWGSVQVELFEVHSASPASLADVLVRPHGIHHMTWFVESIDEEQERLDRHGWPQVLRAETGSGFAYAFHDARADLGHLVEIYRPTDRVLALYGSVADAADGWDGRDPVREL